jgi:hypothetical protein
MHIYKLVNCYGTVVYQTDNFTEFENEHKYFNSFCEHPPYQLRVGNTIYLDIEDYRIGLERGHMWKGEEMKEQITADQTDAINPAHYQDIVPGLQYMQVMAHTLKGFEGVEAHLLGQVYKYLMRLGRKDPKIQDSEKALWYLSCLVKYYKTGTVQVDN